MGLHKDHKRKRERKNEDDNDKTNKPMFIDYKREIMIKRRNLKDRKIRIEDDLT